MEHLDGKPAALLQAVNREPLERVINGTTEEKHTSYLKAVPTKGIYIFKGLGDIKKR